MSTDRWMSRCQGPWKRGIKGCEGQDLAEYALLASLIALVAVLAVAALGGALVALWGNITAAFAALP